MHIYQNDDFVTELKYLLQNDRWCNRVTAGYDHVKNVLAMDRAIDRHIGFYEQFIRVVPK